MRDHYNIVYTHKLAYTGSVCRTELKDVVGTLRRRGIPAVLVISSATGYQEHTHTHTKMKVKWNAELSEAISNANDS